MDRNRFYGVIFLEAERLILCQVVLLMIVIIKKIVTILLLPLLQTKPFNNTYLFLTACN